MSNIPSHASTLSIGRRLGDSADGEGSDSSDYNKPAHGDTLRLKSGFLPHPTHAGRYMSRRRHNDGSSSVCVAVISYAKFFHDVFPQKQNDKGQRLTTAKEAFCPVMRSSAHPSNLRVIIERFAVEPRRLNTHGVPRFRSTERIVQ